MKNRLGDEVDGSDNYDFQLAAFEREFGPKMTEDQVALMTLIGDYSASEVQCLRYLRHFFLNDPIEPGFRNKVLDQIVVDNRSISGIMNVKSE